MNQAFLPTVYLFAGPLCFSFLMDLLMAELIKLPKMAGFTHEADHAGAPGDCID